MQLAYLTPHGVLQARGRLRISRPRPACACLGRQVAVPADVCGHEGVRERVDIAATSQPAEVRLVAPSNLIEQSIPVCLCTDASCRDRRVNRLSPIARFEMGIAGGQRREQALPVRDDATTDWSALDQAHGTFSLQQVESVVADVLVDGFHAADFHTDPARQFLDGILEDRAGSPRTN